MQLNVCTSPTLNLSCIVITLWLSILHMLLFCHNTSHVRIPYMFVAVCTMLNYVFRLLACKKFPHLVSCRVFKLVNLVIQRWPPLT